MLQILKPVQDDKHWAVVGSIKLISTYIALSCCPDSSGYFSILKLEARMKVTDSVTTPIEIGAGSQTLGFCSKT